jgi:AraC-like DNA-binding protein
MHTPQGYHDRIHCHDYRDEHFVPALMVIAAGVSRWGEGVCYERQRPIAVSVNLVTAGSARFRHRGFDGEVLPGQVTVTHMGSDMVYATGQAGYMHKRFITIAGAALPAHLTAMGLDNVVFLTPRSVSTVAALLRDGYALLACKRGNFVDNLAVAAHRLLNELGRSVSQSYSPSVSAAVDYMQQNLAQNVSLKELAHVAATSTRSLIRQFHQAFGVAPLQFMLRRRLRWAEHLLLTTELSVKEIAHTIGYNDPLCFSAQFRKHAGTSPRAFRRTPYGAGDVLSG